MAAVLFCAPTRARYTVVDGRVIVDKGELVTLDLGRKWPRTIATRRASPPFTARQ